MGLPLEHAWRCAEFQWPSVSTGTLSRADTESKGNALPPPPPSPPPPPTPPPPFLAPLLLLLLLLLQLQLLRLRLRLSETNLYEYNAAVSLHCCTTPRRKSDVFGNETDLTAQTVSATALQNFSGFLSGPCTGLAAQPAALAHGYPAKATSSRFFLYRPSVGMRKNPDMLSVNHKGA